MRIYKLRTWNKIVLGVFILIVLVLFAAPRFVKKYTIKNSHDLIGRKLEIDKIRINYFSGALRIKQLTLFEADGKTPFAGFEKLLVNLDYWPLFRGELLISEIELSSFYSNIDQNGAQFNFSDLIVAEDSSGIEEIEKDSIQKEPLLISLNNITIAAGNISYTDKQLEHTISLNDIDLFIPGFTFNRGSTDLKLDFDFQKGGSIYTDLNYSPLDSTFALLLEMDSINLDIIEPYVRSSIDISDLDGYYSNAISINGNLQNLMHFQMSGWNRVDGVVLNDMDNRNILSFDRFFIALDTLQLDRNNLEIAEVSLVKPYLLVELFDSTNNWVAMMRQNEAQNTDTIPDVKPEKKDSSNFIYVVKKLNLIGGKVDFNDNSLSEPFSSSVHDISIKSREINQSSTHVELEVEAILNESAEINTLAVLNMLDQDDISLNLDLKKFAMNDVEPYLEHYLGYPVESGFMNFNTSNELEINQLISSNKLFVHNFKLGESDKSNALIKIPLKLALGILSDKNGDIKLDIPLESKGDETSVKNLGKIVAVTFANLIVKAATKPAELLGALYGANPEKLNQINIGILDDMPDEDNLKTLDLITEILIDKPQLSVRFDYVIDKSNFNDTLAMTMTRQAYRDAKKLTAPIPDSTLLSFLSKKLNHTDADSHELKKLSLKFIGTDYLNHRYDSVVVKHVDFLSDYLRSHDMLDESRYLIKVDTSGDRSYMEKYQATFFVEFFAKGD